MTASKGRFLVIGRAGMDFYADPPGVKLEEAERFTASLGGSSANIAAGLCRQGCAADLVTRVSDDAVGRYCLRQLAHYGVGTGFVRAEGGEARNSLAVVDTRLTDISSVIYRNGAADFAMDLSDVSGIDYSAYDGVITTGTVLAAEPARSAAFHAFEAARGAGVEVILDVDYRPYSWPSPEEAAEICTRAAEAADVVIGNDDEFGVLANDYDAGLGTARSLAQGGRTIVYKMGPLGAVTFAEGRETRTGIYKVDALKPTGAGDAFMAGFLAARARGRPIEEAVLRGSATAAIVVTKVGCAPAMPDTGTLDAFIAEHPGPTKTEES